MRPRRAAVAADGDARGSADGDDEGAGMGTNLALPGSFGQLAAMQSLELDQNQLTTLPESFGKLAALQTLQDVGFGRIRRSPDGARASSSNHTLYIACGEAFVAGSWAWIHLILLRS